MFVNGMHCRNYWVRYKSNRNAIIVLPLRFPLGSNTNSVWSLGWWYWYTRPYRASSLRFGIGYLPHSSAAVALRPSLLLGKYKQDFLPLLLMTLSCEKTTRKVQNFEISDIAWALSCWPHPSSAVLPTIGAQVISCQIFCFSTKKEPFCIL